jgi:hypothetical protein
MKPFPILVIHLLLSSKQNGRLADDRLLFRLPTFDEKKPQLNYGGLEKPDGSVTRTSPLPSK